MQLVLPQTDDRRHVPPSSCASGAVKPVLRRKLHHGIMQIGWNRQRAVCRLFNPLPPVKCVLGHQRSSRMPLKNGCRTYPRRNAILQTNVNLRQGGLSDLFVQSAAFMVLDKLRQGCLMQFRQYIAELGRFGFPGCERGPVDSAQGADQGVPVLSAYFPVLVPMSVIDAHGKSLSGGWSRKGKDDD